LNAPARLNLSRAECVAQAGATTSRRSCRVSLPFLGVSEFAHRVSLLPASRRLVPNSIGHPTPSWQLRAPAPVEAEQARRREIEAPERELGDVTLLTARARLSRSAVTFPPRARRRLNPVVGVKRLALVHEPLAKAGTDRRSLPLPPRVPVGVAEGEHLPQQLWWQPP
jgi:hypothetical protein